MDVNEPKQRALRRLALLSAAGLGALSLLASSAGAAPTLVTVASFDEPIYVTGARWDTSRVFVVERAGRVRLVKNGVLAFTPFLDISSLVRNGGAGGLLSIAFPQKDTKRFYALYTDDVGIRVSEFRLASRDRATTSKSRTLLTLPHSAARDHYGGQLQFGSDNYLYVSIGDGGDGGGNAQNLGSWWGKVLRINTASGSGSPYRVPSDNPFVATAGAKPEIWAYGLRNPWRLSFDRQTGDLVIGDVGQARADEIDFTRRVDGGGRGANFGWNCFEGLQAYAGAPAGCGSSSPTPHVPPVLEKVLPAEAIGGWCHYSITGGYVVRDAAVPSLNGRYLYGDFCSGELRSVALATPTASDDQPTGITLPTLSLVSFGEDGAGHVYVVSRGGGVYRLVEAAP
jgi:glucose/arabinose dehydrogenase